jgi:hypothetical protein
MIFVGKLFDEYSSTFFLWGDLTPLILEMNYRDKIEKNEDCRDTLFILRGVIRFEARGFLSKLIFKSVFMCGTFFVVDFLLGRLCSCFIMFLGFVSSFLDCLESRFIYVVISSPVLSCILLWNEHWCERRCSFLSINLPFPHSYYSALSPKEFYSIIRFYLSVFVFACSLCAHVLCEIIIFPFSLKKNREDEKWCRHRMIVSSLMMMINSTIEFNWCLLNKLEFVCLSCLMASRFPWFISSRNTRCNSNEIDSSTQRVYHLRLERKIPKKMNEKTIISWTSEWKPREHDFVVYAWLSKIKRRVVIRTKWIFRLLSYSQSSLNLSWKSVVLSSPALFLIV